MAVCDTKMEENFSTSGRTNFNTTAYEGLHVIPKTMLEVNWSASLESGCISIG
jgi:hypothetical protein